jgi:hypothetical protein
MSRSFLRLNGANSVLLSIWMVSGEGTWIMAFTRFTGLAHNSVSALDLLSLPNVTGETFVDIIPGFKLLDRRIIDRISIEGRHAPVFAPLHLSVLIVQSFNRPLYTSRQKASQHRCFLLTRRVVTNGSGHGLLVGACAFARAEGATVQS